VFHLGLNTVEQILQGQQPVDFRQPAEEVAASESFIDRHAAMTDRGPKVESPD
jgi:hypothetical protein